MHMNKTALLYAVPFAALTLIALVGGGVPLQEGLPDDDKACFSDLRDVPWFAAGWMSASMHEQGTGVAALPATGVSLPEFGHPKLKNGPALVTISPDMGVPEGIGSSEPDSPTRQRTPFGFDADEVPENAGNIWADSNPSWGWLADGVLERNEGSGNRVEDESLIFRDTSAGRDSYSWYDSSESDGEEGVPWRDSVLEKKTSVGIDGWRRGLERAAPRR
jgi:hypothetical protein